MRGPQSQQTSLARRLRRVSTNAETRLWQKLRARQLAGFKFVRQEPVGHYVVDFICRDEKLIVEVDGGQHADNQRDKARDEWLNAEGYRVLRFWNNDVLSNMSGVLEVIASALEATKNSPSPRPSPREERGEEALFMLGRF